MRILVTTDGSRRSLRALPHAAELARSVSGDIALVRVLDPRGDVAGDFAPTVAEAVQQVAARWEQEMTSALGGVGVPARAHVVTMERTERVPDAVLRAAREQRAQLICMMSQGAGFLQAALHGSVATAVLASAQVPLLLVGPAARKPTGSGSYHIVVTTDGSEAAAAALPALQQLFRGVSPESVRFTALRVFEDTFGPVDHDEALEIATRELSAFARRVPRRFACDHEVRDLRGLQQVEDAILSAANARSADAVCMATHGHSLTRRVLLGSVALGVLRRARMPLLLTRAED